MPSEVEVQPRCHPSAETYARFGEKTIELCCEQCNAVVAALKVKPVSGVVQCRVRGSEDGKVVTWNFCGVEMEMETAQFLRIMEYLETFRESYVIHRATR